MSTQIIGMPSQPDKGGSLLYLDNVSKSFDGFKAINALSLVIGKGEMRAIIGPNGAGKTTTSSPARPGPIRAKSSFAAPWT